VSRGTWYVAPRHIWFDGSSPLNFSPSCLFNPLSLLFLFLSHPFAKKQKFSCGSFKDPRLLYVSFSAFLVKQNCLQFKVFEGTKRSIIHCFQSVSTSFYFTAFFLKFCHNYCALRMLPGRNSTRIFLLKKLGFPDISWGLDFVHVRYTVATPTDLKLWDKTEYVKCSV